MISRPKRSTMKGTVLNLTSLLALCCMVMISANPLGPHGEWVLCIGQDGHLEVEVAEAGRCVDCLVQDEHQSIPPSVSSTGDHCGACTDIGFVNQETHVRPATKISKLVKIGTLAPTRPGTPIWHERASYWERPWTPLHRTPANTFLRTIRLII